VEAGKADELGSHPSPASAWTAEDQRLSESSGVSDAAPPRWPRRAGYDRQGDALPGQHVIGEDAMRLAADITRDQLELESGGHVRYRPPWLL
jgi:hypothetical protein